MAHWWMIAIGVLLAVIGGVWDLVRKASVHRHVPEASRWHGPFRFFHFGGAWRRHEQAQGRSGAHAHTPMALFLVGMALIAAAVVKANF